MFYKFTDEKDLGKFTQALKEREIEFETKGKTVEVPAISLTDYKYVMYGITTLPKASNTRSNSMKSMDEFNNKLLNGKL